MAAASTPSVATSENIATSLRSRALTGSAWTLGGYVAGQGLRLAGNVVLARLLFPEAFGLMTLVGLFMQGLQMCSDLGLAPGIIQSDRGGDRRFLDTAWTMQVIRGAALWLLACLGAWPFAVFMEQPSLAWLIPVAGLSAVVAGFASTAPITLNRDLRLGRVVLWELTGQGVGVAVMVAWALIVPSIWSLVAGGLAAALYRTITSHRLTDDARNRFAWDPESARSLLRFGRWIFISTILTFLAMQLDKVMLGKMLDVERLGVYAVAVGFALFASRLVKTVGRRVGFPALAEVARERPHRLRANLRKMRLALIGAAAAAAVPMIVGGPWVVELLYDSRYHDAGWMLQLLGAGALATAVASSAGQALMALGRTFAIMLVLVTQIGLLVAGIVIGYRGWGDVGLVAGVAAAEFLNYPIVACVLARRGLWQPAIDLPVMGGAVAILAAGLWLHA